MEGADEILAAGMIDRRLAADRGIHLREQRRRHLHEVHAALVAGRDKAGQVADHAAAERQDRAVAREAVGDQYVEYARRDCQASCVPRRPGSMTSTMRRVAQARAQGAQVQRRHGGIADDEHVAAGRAPKIGGDPSSPASMRIG